MHVPLITKHTVGLCFLLVATCRATSGCNLHNHNHSVPLDDSAVAPQRIRHNGRRLNHAQCQQCITIDTYFWTFHGTAGVDGDPLQNPSVEMMQEQFDILVDRFRDTPFTFRLVQNEIVVNQDFYGKHMGETMDAMIRTYWVDGTNKLNAYFGGAHHGSFATTAGISLESEVIGPGDAVYTDITTVPGLPFNQNEDYDDRSLGFTLVHEVGHWLGLVHTFDTPFDDEAPNFESDIMCSDSNPGDYVDDTPRSSVSTYCPVGKDSCPGQGGPDPIHNYMDYTSDTCKTREEGFTPGQVQRMFTWWSLYRELASVCNSEDSMLFEMELQIAEDSRNRIQLEAMDGSFYLNDEEQGYDDLSEFGGDTITLDLCLRRGRVYTFTVYDDSGTNASTVVARLDGGVLQQSATTAGAVAVFVFTAPLSSPTQSPSPLLSMAPNPASTTTITRTAFITLVLNFAWETEDVSVLIQTLVPTTETPQVIYNKPYDAFPEPDFQNIRFVETIAVDANVAYSLQIRQRFESSGIDSYALYFGRVASDEFLQFRESAVDAFEGNTFVVETTGASSSPQQPTLRPAPSSTPSPLTTTEEPSLAAPDSSSSSGPSTCFSGRNYVNTKDRGYIRMQELTVGDQVSIGKNNGDREQFSTVYAFGHRQEHELASFLLLLPSKLELSPSHMLYVFPQQPPPPQPQPKDTPRTTGPSPDPPLLLPAHMVQVGDVLSDGRPVTSIRTVQRVGLYNPFTVSGTISVQNIQCSNYIAVLSQSPYLVEWSWSGCWLLSWWWSSPSADGSQHHTSSHPPPFPRPAADTRRRGILHYHTLSHAVLFPLRVWCHWFGFPTDLDETTGWSRWAALWHNCLHHHQYYYYRLLLPLQPWTLLGEDDSFWDSSIGMLRARLGVVLLLGLFLLSAAAAGWAAIQEGHSVLACSVGL